MRLRIPQPIQMVFKQRKLVLSFQPDIDNKNLTFCRTIFQDFSGEFTYCHAQVWYVTISKNTLIFPENKNKWRGRNHEGL
ncbi:MAG: hypothetical protein MK025_12415 [Acidobacteriia bacterium]|nr:hypothetical protein [Terriglobia bacterium]